MFVKNAQGQWFLGHATGQKHSDIFKGMPEPALLELQEETRIIIAPSALEDTGLHSYCSDKKLHIFKTFLEVDPAQLKCISFFEHPVSQEIIAEMDAFSWHTLAQAKEKVVPRCGLFSIDYQGLLPCHAQVAFHL